MAFASIFAAGLIATQISSFILPTDFKVVGQDFTIAQINLLSTNNKHQAVLKQVKTLDPDIISFQEVNRGWNQSLNKELKDSHPYRHSIPWENNFGIALYSKHPFTKVETQFINGLPNIYSCININGRNLELLSSHTYAPVTPSMFKKRNAQLEEIGKTLAGFNQNCIAIGDYNIVPWARELKAMKKTADLKSARNRLASTFPAGFQLLRIPIDHVFYKGDLGASSFKVFDIPGSDHRGLLCGFKFMKEE